MANLSITPELLWTARDMFRYPEPTNISDLRNELQTLLEWAEARGGEPNADWRQGWEEAADLQQMQVDFTALFVNAVPTARAHPFAGWYQGETVLFGASDRRVRKLFQDYGVEFDDLKMPADHIMVELEFAALMAEQFSHTGNSCFYRALQEFVTGHLEPWVYQFLLAVEENARNDFYRYLAKSLKVLITQLQIELKEVA